MTDAPPSRQRPGLFDVSSARIGLGRCGVAMPTRPILDFQFAHARARDAVHTHFDSDALASGLTPRQSIVVESRAIDRSHYLRRPDLGRRLSEANAGLLGPSGCDVAIVIGDGLSAQAIHNHALPLLAELLPRLDGWSFAPIILAKQARVALGDEIGALLAVRMVVMLIGERPGLSASDSLGVYLTWAPRIGCNDSQRNCISNIRSQGLGYEEASRRIARLMAGARRLKVTGVQLKDETSSRSLSPPTYRGQ